jgi:anhydro-N-acetylmuramic acid kinase
MSGTSLDGVDAALADFDDEFPRLVASHFVPYSAELRGALLELHVPGRDELQRAARLGMEISELYACAAQELLRKAGQPRVAAMGCHGQTVRHRPEAGYTIQLVNGALLAERTGLTTVVDFRSRDIAAGGQGAPLVPAFHAACLALPGTERAILNIGGIANLTCLPNQGPVTGFDTGPGNVLIDTWARQHFGRDYDVDGSIAATGTVQDVLLDKLLRDEFFSRRPPKSTGRDRFNEAWLESFGLQGSRPEDVMATLAELTSRTASDAVRSWCHGAAEVFVCGGGVHNHHLLRRLAVNLGGTRVASTSELGLDPDWVEAMAFAWLAKQCLAGEPGNLSTVTGAKGPRVLGAIYPA